MHHADLSIPFTNPVLIFAFTMLLTLVVPFLAERVRVPGLVGLILAGVVVGPNGLGLLERDATLVLLSTVGLLFIMFEAGLEVNLHEFARYRRHSVVFGVLTFLIPQVSGALAARMLLGFDWWPSVLLGSIFASHTLLAYPIASRLGLRTDPSVTTAIGGTIITDTLTLLVLAIVANSVSGDPTLAFWVRMLGLMALYTFVVLWGLPRLGRRVLRHVPSGGAEAFLFVLAAVFTVAFAAEMVGVEPIIGAFLAGLALNRLVPEGSALSSRLRFAGESLFVPFFLLATGMLVDVRVLFSGLEAWKVAGLMLALALGGKWIAVKTTQRLFGYTSDQGTLLYGLSIPQAAATLAATLVGVRLELFDTSVLNGAILLILVSCVAGPVLTEVFGRRVAAARAAAPEGDEAPQRLLVPLSNPSTADALLDTALLLRPDAYDAPILPLAVALDDGTTEATDARVATAEALARHAAEHLAPTDVPCVPLTRLDFNVASAIARAAREQRASAVVIGWNGERLPGQRVFGTVLDQVLAETGALLVVCRIVQPLATVEELLLALPPLVEHEPGVAVALDALRHMAARLGTTVRVLTADADAVAPLLARPGPSVPFVVEALGRWDGLAAHLAGLPPLPRALVLLGARERTVAHTAALDRLPRQVASAFPDLSLLIAYPAIPVASGDPTPLALPRTERPPQVTW